LGRRRLFGEKEKRRRPPKNWSAKRLADKRRAEGEVKRGELRKGFGRLVWRAGVINFR